MESESVIEPPKMKSDPKHHERKKTLLKRSFDFVHVKLYGDGDKIIPSHVDT